MSEITDHRVEHLKLIQAVVTRMADMGAALKRYCIMVTAAALALAAGTQIAGIALLAAPPVAVFWALDAMYLRQERWFRELYDRATGDRVPLFQLTPPEEIRRSVGFRATLWSWATVGLYLPLIAFLVVVAGVLYAVA